MNHPWLKNLIEEFPDLASFSFDWAHFSKEFAQKMETCEISLCEKKRHRADFSELKKGFGSQLLCVQIALSPIGTVLLGISYDDAAKLFESVFSQQTQPSTALQEGFFRYALLNALSVLETMKPFSNLSLQMGSEEELSGDALFIDLQARLCNEKSVALRLAIPASVLQNASEHFSAVESFSMEEARKIDLPLVLKAGSVHLNDEERAQLKSGDFLLLDQAGYNEKTQKGHAVLMYKETALFSVEIEKNQLKIAKPALNAPENWSMELGRVEMNLEKLLLFSEGDLLEMPEFPPETVSIVEKEEKVGLAELTHLGDKPGLRILEIG